MTYREIREAGQTELRKQLAVLRQREGRGPMAAFEADCIRCELSIRNGGCAHWPSSDDYFPRHATR